MNYRRRPRDPVVIPYPYLEDITALSVVGIPNTYTDLTPAFQENRWYKVTAAQQITVLGGHTLVILRDRPDNTQSMLWTTVPAGSTLDINLLANDFILVYAGATVPIAIAGFETFYLIDVADNYEIRTFVAFKSNIRFRFTQAN